jgi:hypothetical protein
MKIFETYTGNAMLNNALMTIEALACLKHVSEITPEILIKLYEEPINGYSLFELNQRFKSYTMIFSLNNPLVNPAKKAENIGPNIYNNILLSIFNNCETNGSQICEISGLRFEKTFEDFYSAEIDKLKTQVKLKKLDAKKEKSELVNLDNTDLSINRCWFPLIGGLGSDAQALPQAKFSLRIHPICIAVMQFLPLSALLYKGSVLLIDSSNFNFTKSYIKSNTEEVVKRISLTPETESIENIKDFAKGNYLLKALKVLEEKGIEDDYSDLNLWSFTNSGTGASCEIDRIPNSLIKKLNRLINNPEIKNELIRVVENRNISGNFLNALGDNQEWYGLFPAKNNEGVSAPFMEAYLNIIGSERKVKIAKYLAYLITKYKSKSFEKYLIKSDAYTEKEYRTDLYSVLIKATESNEWNFYHQIQILDSLEAFPVRNTTYNIHKITHYFYQKQAFVKTLDDGIVELSEVENICRWLIALIQNDSNPQNTIKRLLDPQDYQSVGYTELLLRSAQYASVNLNSIFYALYDNNGKSSRFGLNELLRIFFSQPEQKKYEVFELKGAGTIIASDYQDWFSKFNDFAKDYQAYYFDKYENKNTGMKPYSKYLNQVSSISSDGVKFMHWFEEAIEYTNAFLKGELSKLPDKWSDDLLYNPQGEYALSLARLAIQFSLRKMYYLSISQQNILTKTL